MEDPSIGQKIRSLRRQATRKTADELRREHAASSYAQSPIGRLATELLTDILALALELDTDRSLKSLMEVCRIWEAIAIASPRLNAIIKSPLSKKEVRTAVKRAKDHPLTIVYSHERVTPTRRMKNFLEETCRNSGKWRSIHVDIVASGEVISWTDLPAPLLEECTLLFDIQYQEQFDVFKGHTPLLRHLTLRGLQVPWSSSVFSNLQTLSVISCTPFQSAVQVLAALSRCPKLVSLDLRLMDAEFGSDAATPSVPVVLDDLAELGVEIISRLVSVPLLTWLRIRPVVSVSVHVRHVEPTEITLPLTAQLAHALQEEHTRIVIWMARWGTRLVVRSTTSSKTLFRLHIDDMPSTDDLLLFSKIDCHGRPITFHAEGTERTTVLYGAGDANVNALPSIITVVSLLSTLDHLVLDGWRDVEISKMMDHLSVPVSSSGLPARWNCTQLKTIELLRCRAYAPAELLATLRARRGARYPSVLLESVEKEVAGLAAPSPIEKVITGCGSGMDEKSFLEIEQVIGLGKLHCCERLECPDECLECATRP